MRKLLILLICCMCLCSCNKIGQKWYDIKDSKGYSFLGEWRWLNVIDKDTVIYKPADADVVKIIINKEKKEVFVNYGQEECQYLIDKIKLINDEFVLYLKDTLSNDGTPYPFKCKFIDNDNALWQYQAEIESEYRLFTKSRHKYKEYSDVSENMPKQWYDIFWIVPFSDDIGDHTGSYYVQITPENDESICKFATTFAFDDIIRYDETNAIGEETKELYNNGNLSEKEEEKFYFDFDVYPHLVNDTLYIMNITSADTLGKIIKDGTDYYLDSRFVHIFSKKIKKTKYGYKVRKGMPKDDDN